MHRLNTSLYDAQFDPENGKRIPIPSWIMDSVIAALLRFQIICKDLGVLNDCIRIIATEATRTAINSAEFMEAIKTATGIDVDLLPKEDEGRIGALGIASGFGDIKGIALDLGGGSAQITWIISQRGNIRISPNGSLSFPYGAAALTRKLAELKEGKSKDEADRDLAAFRQEMKDNFVDAYGTLQIPKDLIDRAKMEGGFPLYLSGGGFRGWGYLLLYLNQTHGRDYPISIINGFTAQKSQFENTDILKEIAHSAKKIFRVSDRRRKQAPAVAFLINVLAEALPHGIKEAHFCQGGIREGILFQELRPSVRMLDPLEVATGRFAPLSAESLNVLILGGIPRPSKNGRRRFPLSISSHVLQAFVNVLYVHSTMSKESSSTSALYSTSTGLMSTTHGVSHADRARLALLLEERYHGELPPREIHFKSSLQQLLSQEEVWWIKYIGKIGFLISRLYPAGAVDEWKPRIILSAEWSNHLGKNRDKQGLELTCSIQKVQNDPMKLKEALKDNVGIIAKVGKPKHWPGGEDGWGMAVSVKVVEEDIL
jgi:retrograde regulation protein 2